MKKLFKIVHKRHKIEPTAIECVTKSVITASAYYFSSKHQHYQAMNDIKMVTHSVLKYPQSCKLILSQHIFSGVGTISAQIRSIPKPPIPPRAKLFGKILVNFPAMLPVFIGVQMPHQLELQRGSNPPPCQTMHS